MKIRHTFVENIPSQLEDFTLYISIKYATTIHKCFCGCGNQVVTPLSPNDWLLSFDGETVSLYPSIGNWSFPCQSHYWINNDEVIWSRQWSRHEIKSVRKKESESKKKYYTQHNKKGNNSQPKKFL